MIIFQIEIALVLCVLFTDLCELQQVMALVCRGADGEEGAMLFTGCCPFLRLPNLLDGCARSKRSIKRSGISPLSVGPLENRLRAGLQP